ncbi:MAG TPA: bifunctional diaminohydroxyphosphoribosylaminopyrimidine deaminase/5-amino-6-(5-phosphoribosylamino)uracil reductase RibD, partial [Planctomycetota bacterium]|nr:bifunctional diaminohydroxyphosphoribosylaminopyrimidine deaminase/5-amino-6-(5-phosphoribosylamino)uracil reductase RibD [Planctomycetota bacterium]
AKTGARPDELVVTLEPCSTHGKTPPCVEAIARAGVKRVIVAAVDRNPAHDGRGLAWLRDHGIEVAHTGDEVRFLAQNRPYARALAARRPFVLAKWAMTLDGRTALADGDSKWVTSEASREMVHRLRGRCEAVAVGVATVLRDDPLLTSRGFQSLASPPARVVFDSTLRTPPNATVVSNHDAPTWIVALASAPADRRVALERAGAEVIPTESDAQTGRVAIRPALAELGRRGVRRVLLEAGPELAGAFRRAGAIDQVLAFVAPKIAGGVETPSAAGSPEAAAMARAVALEETYVERIGDDVLIGGFVGPEPAP